MWAIFKYKPLMSFRKYHHLVLHSMFVKCYHLMNRKPILIHSSLSSLVFVYGSLTVKQFTSSMMCEFGCLFITNSTLLKLNRNFKNMMPLKQTVLRKFTLKWYTHQNLTAGSCYYPVLSSLIQYEIHILMNNLFTG